MHRRNFIISGLSTIPFLANAKNNQTTEPKTIKPKALKKGDTIGLVCPAFNTTSRQEVNFAIECFEKLGLNVKIGKNLFNRNGYLAGKDEERAADINDFFADKNIQGIVAMNGGWGSARILDLINYQNIINNPKVFMGYSDITSLLNAIYTQTGLVTFHGPVGGSTYNKFSVDYLKQTLFDAKNTFMHNPESNEDNLTPTKERIWTITEGKAKGKLIGGNLTVLTTILGSKYVPDFKNAILFLEDIGEDIYSVDRMLTQLKLNGILNQISGFVFGKCTDCKATMGSALGSLTLEDLFNDHIIPLKIPAFSGAMIGHIESKFTIPIGISAQIDAKLGTIELLESAVI